MKDCFKVLGTYCQGLEDSKLSLNKGLEGPQEAQPAYDRKNRGWQPFYAT